MGVLWTAAWCGQEVAWHERMGWKAVVGLRGDPVEELLECMAHLSDRVEQKPSAVMYTGWYRQLVADEVEALAVVGTEVVGEHVLVVVGEDGSVHSLGAVVVEAAHFALD